MFSMNVWKTRHYTSDHGGQPTANSKSSVQRQRRTDDQVSWVGNAAQEVGDDWQSVVAVYWRCPRLTFTTQSVRYCAALCCWHRRTVTPSLYCTRSGTSSQCKSACSRRDRPRSNLRVPLTRHAVAFNARWSLSVTDLGAPTSTELK